jgi:hypothetical protein
MFAVMMQSAAAAWSPWVVVAFVVVLLAVRVEWSAVTSRQRAVAIAVLVAVFGLAIAQEVSAAILYWPCRDWYPDWLCDLWGL